MKSLAGLSVSAIVLALFCQACIVVPEATDDILHEWKTHVNKARELAKNSKSKEAESEYALASKALQRESGLLIYEALTLRELGLLYQSEKRDADAKAVFLKAADLFQAQRKKDAEIYSIYTRQHFDVLYQLGMLAQKEDQKLKAVEFFRQALWADSSNELADKCKEQLLFLEGAVGIRTQIPESIFKAVREIAGVSDSHRLQTNHIISLVRQAISRSDKVLATQYLTALDDLGKQRNDWGCQAQVKFDFIRLYYVDDKLDQALKECEEALRQAEENEEYSNLKFTYLLWMYKIQDRLNHTDDAEKYWNEVLKLSKEDKSNKVIKRAELILGQILELDVDYRHNEAAIRGFKKLFELLAKSKISPVQLGHYQSVCGNAYLNNGNFEEAKAMFLEAMKNATLQADKFAIFAGLTSADLALHESVEAEEYAMKARASLVDGPSKVTVFMLLAKCAHANGNPKGALKFLDKADAEIEKLKGTQSPDYIAAVSNNSRVLKKQFESR